MRNTNFDCDSWNLATHHHQPLSNDETSLHLNAIAFTTDELLFLVEHFKPKQNTEIFLKCYEIAF